MKRLIPVLSFTFLVSTVCLATGRKQPDTPVPLKKNSFSLELMGNGIFYSFQYERILFSKNSFHLAARIGFNVLPFAGNSPYAQEFACAIFPVESTVFIGKNQHFFETGMGHSYNTQVYHKGTADDFEKYRMHFLSFRLGYRFQKPGGRFLFRIALLPILAYKPGYTGTYLANENYSPNIWKGDEQKTRLNWWAGLTIGRCF